MKLPKLIGFIWCLATSLAALSQKIDYGNDPSEQIAVNPAIFGGDVSAFAESVLKSISSK